MSAELSTQEFNLFRKYIEEQCGIDVQADKAYLIESRLSKLLADSGLSSFEELYNRVTHLNDKSMTEKIIDAITTNETQWFRDNTPWEILENLIIPVWIQEFHEGKRAKVRIWSAACSTGQEPYSIALSIEKYLAKNQITDIFPSQFEIVATDISATVLEIARMGKYSSVSIIRGLSETDKQKYFQNQEHTWILDETIKNRVKFEQFNLQNSFLIWGKFDLVFCRYVIIYFSESFKQEIIDKMAGVLEPGGIFFLGSSELFTGTKAYFEMKTYQNGVYYQRR
jgi:chemotaxis protein methyltransferase CheR